ncbi:MAG TPA: DUF2203 domain-containing protein [Ignavibacteria bacterium]|nr:hypothetical protein [Bacteroidota bacterium]HRI84616.1 DUF2203 domain-containing protein [Ignavibacteria bacterium]HRJ98307.1 DUF2203 domain-containing protein [Ignavibacteria bacterium]
MLHTKHFTLIEASSILPEVKIILKEIIRLKKNLDKTGYNIYAHNYFSKIGTNGSGKYPDDLLILIEKVKKITEMGILIKNIDTGLIDFPHIRSNGEEVYLCYYLGEDGLNFWHSVSDGFSGRKDINEL